MTDITQEQADFDSHRIEGWASMDKERRRIDVPLISEVLDGLWQGGCKHGVKLPWDFDLVISLYPWEQYDIGPNTIRVEIEAYDSSDVPDLSEAVTLAYDAWKDGKKLLLHCQAGLNRSGLVAAQVLMKAGMSAEAAIALLRKNRSDVVLCNRHFEEYLLGLDDD